MIRQIEIIDQPYSGQFIERIFDIQNVWNSPQWTWVKFTEENESNWCGQFRGSPIAVGISNKLDFLYILTADHFYELNKLDGEIHNIFPQSNFINIVKTPHDEFILYDYGNLYFLKEEVKECLKIESPFNMDFIEFKFWDNNKFVFTCYEIGIYDDRTMEMDLEGLAIKARNAT